MRRFLSKLLGYGAVFLLSFLFGLYHSFPYELLAQRLFEAVHSRFGIQIDVGELSPWWLVGLQAREVEIEVPRRNKSDPLQIHLDRIIGRLHPLESLLSQLTVTVDVLDEALGQTSTTVHFDEPLVGIDVARLDVQVGAIPGVWDDLGVGFQGRARGQADLSAPLLKSGAGVDVTKLAGTTDLVVEDAKFGGGMLKGFALPPIDLGTVPLKLEIEDGTARTDGPQRIRGPELEAEVDGTLKLRPIFLTSRLDVSLRFKPTDAFWKKHEKLAGLVQALLKSAKGADGWYGYRITGQLARPNFRPMRR